MVDFTNSLLTTQETENLHLCFTLDEKIYALNAKNVLEVATLPLVNNPQKLPEYIVGILNYNDLFINVVDIRKVFSLPIQKYNISNKIIVIKGEESLFAIIVDKVTNFFGAHIKDIQRTMGENTGKIIKTFYKENENVVNIVDIPSLEDFVKKSHNLENSTDYSELFPSDEESVCIMQKRRYEIAKLPSMNIDTTIYGKDQYVIFKMQNHTYCIHSSNVKELISLKNYPITKIPYSPSYILGIINIKGNFYSVLDLKQFIGFNDAGSKSSNNESKAIVLELQELKLALLVDDISNIINIAKENIVLKNEKNLDELFIKAEAYIDGDIYNILNLDKLINEDRLYMNSQS